MVINERSVATPPLPTYSVKFIQPAKATGHVHVLTTATAATTTPAPPGEPFVALHDPP